MFSILNYNALDKFWDATQKKVLPGSSSNIKYSPPKMINIMGPVPFLIFLLGLFSYLIKKKDNLALATKIFVLIFALIYFSIIFVGRSWLAKRLTLQISLLVIILGGYAVFRLINLKFNPWFQKIIFFLLIIVFLIPLYNFMGQRGYTVSWKYFDALDWIKKNIPHTKVISDPFTLFMVQGLGNVEPAYEFGRPISRVKDEGALEIIFKSQDPEATVDFIRKKSIDYVIVDSQYTLRRAGPAIDKFKSDFFKEIYTNQYTTNSTLTIYRPSN